MKKAKVNPYFTHPKSEGQAKSMAAKVKALGQYELDGALDTAVRFRDVLLTRALLEAGADPNSRDANNQTVLGAAVKRGHIELTRLILDHGGDINGRTTLNTPLIDALFEGDLPMIDYLLSRGADVNATGPRPVTALHVATRFRRDPKLVATLLKRGADARVKDREGLTPLDWAIMNGDREIEGLLRRGINASQAKRTEAAKQKPVRRKPKRK